MPCFPFGSCKVHLSDFTSAILSHTLWGRIYQTMSCNQLQGGRVYARCSILSLRAQPIGTGLSSGPSLPDPLVPEWQSSDGT